MNSNFLETGLAAEFRQGKRFPMIITRNLTLTVKTDLGL